MITKESLKKELVLTESKANFDNRILEKDRRDYLKHLEEYDKETDKLIDKYEKAKKSGDKKTAKRLKKEITKRSEKNLHIIDRLEETGRKVPVHRKSQFQELEMDVYKGKMASKDLNDISKKRLKELTTINPFKRVKENDWKKAAAYVGAVSDKKKNKAIKDGVKSHMVLKKTIDKHFEDK